MRNVFETTPRHIRTSCIDNIVFFALFLLTFLFGQRLQDLIYVYLIFFIVGGLCVFRIIQNHGILFFPREIYLLLLFYVWLYVSALANMEYCAQSLNTIFDLTMLYGVFFLVLSYIHLCRNLEQILIALFLAGMCFGIAIISSEGGLSIYILRAMEGRRLGDYYGNQNAIGLDLCFSFSAGCYLLVKKRKLIWLFPFIPIIIAAVGTGSRKVIIFIALISVVFIIFYVKDTTKRWSVKRYKKYLKFVAVGALFLIILLSTGFLDSVLDRFAQMAGLFSGQAEASADTRFSMIKIGLLSFSDYPIFGVGIGNSGRITMKYLGWDTYLHNNYIEILSSTGITGLLAYYGFYIIIMVKLINRYRKTHNSLYFWGVATLGVQLILEVAYVSYLSKKMPYYTAFWLYLATDNFQDEYERKHFERECISVGSQI